MSNSALNFTTDEASTNFTTPAFDQIDILEFDGLGFKFLLVCSSYKRLCDLAHHHMSSK